MMAKVLITPVKSSGVEPYELEGTLTSKVFDGETIYYIAGGSYPAEIVTILKDENQPADSVKNPNRKVVLINGQKEEKGA